MVDFSSDGTLGTNRGHILDLIVLGRRDEWLNTYQKYRLSSLEQRSDKLILFNSLRSILETISIELKETMKRKFKNKDSSSDDYFKRLNTIENDDDLMYCFNKFNELLDLLKITRIDNKAYVDTTSVESENKAKGL